MSSRTIWTGLLLSRKRRNTTRIIREYQTLGISQGRVLAELTGLIIQNEVGSISTPATISYFKTKIPMIISRDIWWQEWTLPIWWTTITEPIKVDTIITLKQKISRIKKSSMLVEKIIQRYSKNIVKVLQKVQRTTYLMTIHERIRMRREELLITKP